MNYDFVDAEVRKKIEEDTNAEAVKAKLELAERFLSVKHRSGDAIKFTKQFEPDGKVYSYLGLCIDGLWYISGTKRPMPMTWPELVMFLISGKVPTSPLNVRRLIDDGSIGPPSTNLTATETSAQQG